MSDDLRPPAPAVGDSLEIILSEDADGDPIVDSVLRDRTGVGEAVRRTRRLAPYPKIQKPRKPGNPSQ